MLPKLKELRKKSKIKQSELAEILNLNTSTISKYESSNTIPSPDILVKIANYFNVTTDYLLSNDIKQKKEPLTIKQGAIILQQKLQGTSLVDNNGNLTENAAEVIAEFLEDNSELLKLKIDLLEKNKV